jgi:hypothetical protein
MALILIGRHKDYFYDNAIVNCSDCKEQLEKVVNYYPHTYHCVHCGKYFIFDLVLNLIEIKDK